MKAAKLRDMTVIELGLEESKLIDQIFRLRFQIAAGQAENPARVHMLRKDLARVKTVLREKSGAAAGSPESRAPKTTAPAEPAAKETAQASPAAGAKPRAAGKGKRASVTTAGASGRNKGAAQKAGAKQERG